MSLPAGYAPIELPGVRGFAWEPALADLRQVLEGGLELYAWAERRGEPAGASGRGEVRAVPAPAPGPERRARWAVRRYRRGGAVAAHLGERYLRLGAHRPFVELRASAAARARGVPTPAVVAGALYPGGVFYRADLVTELIPEGRELSELLFGAPSAPEAEALAALRATGRLVRRLEDARLAHRDLNATNVLITRGGERALAHALDLDRCRVLPDAAPPPGPRMRLRLRRSLRKLERTRGRGLGHARWAALAEGLGEDP